MLAVHESSWKLSKSSVSLQTARQRHAPHRFRRSYFRKRQGETVQVLEQAHRSRIQNLEWQIRRANGARNCKRSAGHSKQQQGPRLQKGACKTGGVTTCFGRMPLLLLTMQPHGAMAFVMQRLLAARASAATALVQRLSPSVALSGRRVSELLSLEHFSPINCDIGMRHSSQSSSSVPVDPQKLRNFAVIGEQAHFGCTGRHACAITN